jgi:hypothetical protein
MSNFRTKILGLAALATAFAGASYGQSPVTITAVSATQGALNLRAEGTTELLGQVSVTITSTTAATGSMTVFLNAPVTSPAASGATAANPITTAVLSYNGASYNGIVSGPTGNQLVFSNVAFPAAAGIVATISNVRVNANAVALTATLTGVTEQPTATVNNVSSVGPVGGSVTVGYIFTTLTAPAVTNVNSTGGTIPVTSYNTATGNPLSKSAGQPFSFAVQVADSIAGAFKTFGTPGNTLTEDADGFANFGTRVQLAFANVPSAVTLYVPVTIVSTTASGTFTLALVPGSTSPEGTFSPTSTTTNAPGAGTYPTASGAALTESYSATGSLTPSNGTVTAVYEVVGVPATPSKVTAYVPVWVIFNPNTITAAPGAITVLETYSPTAAAAAATTVPNFAPVTTAPLNASSITLAQTSLLFPFVTNVPGFDTGIALSNTNTDPFGSTPTAGTCGLNFYGAGAPTPSTGVAAPGGSYASGTSGTPFLVSSVAPNFNGYMIATCNFPNAHGFAYIVYNFGQSNGATMGYVASVLNRVPGITSETLGQ